MVYFCIFVVSVLKHPRTPPTPGMVDYQTPDHEQLMKRLRPTPSAEEVVPKFICIMHTILGYFIVFFLIPLPSNSIVCFVFVTMLVFISVLQFSGYLLSISTANLVTG